MGLARMSRSGLYRATKARLELTIAYQQGTVIWQSARLQLVGITAMIQQLTSAAWTITAIFWAAIAVMLGHPIGAILLLSALRLAGPMALTTIALHMLLAINAIIRMAVIQQAASSSSTRQNRRHARRLRIAAFQAGSAEHQKILGYKNTIVYPGIEIRYLYKCHLPISIEFYCSDQ
jgi:hypothetical protein